eukprot:m.236134 g.236134  ORF g.236134 m.236134 type:complete len:346 (-) comp26540_c1_seq5:581-1618(-)
MLRIGVVSEIQGLEAHLKEALQKLSLSFSIMPSEDAFATAEICLADPSLIKPNLEHIGPNLKWIQSTWAGVNLIMEAFSANPSLVYPPKYLLTRFAGHFGPPMADYVLGHILARERHTSMYAKLQEKSQWRHDTSLQPTDTTPVKKTTYRLAKDLKVGIVGLGEIGTAVAHTCSLMGMEVFGLARKPRSPENQDGSTAKAVVSKVFLPEEKLDLFAKCDYIVNLLPSTKETAGWIHPKDFEVCKTEGMGCCFINVGRGDVMAGGDQGIIEALDNHGLKAAILDVFEQEPLPKDSGLWSHPKVTITPHISAQSQASQVVEAFVDNLQRYVKDPQSVKYRVDFNSGY